VLRGFCPLLAILSGGGATEPPPPEPEPEPSNCATPEDVIAARDYIVANFPTGMATTAQLNAATADVLAAIEAAKDEVLAAIAAIPTTPPVPAGYAVVGGVQFAKLADAAAAVPLNGVVEIYGELRDLNATAAFTRSCTIRGMTPDAKLNWTLGTTAPMAFSKGLIVCEGAGGSFLVENLELYGARTPDSTGAGLRGSTGTAALTVRNCNIHDNENGVLATSLVQVYEDNTFLNNGNAAGSAHGIYVNSSNVNDVTAERNSFGAAIVGHHFKSRAKKLTFRQNKVAELNGACSRQMDISNGGDCLIELNLFEQGPNALNNGFIGYAPEGLTLDGRLNQFLFRDNILINDYTSAIGVRLYNPVTLEEVVRNSFVAVSTPAVNLTLDATNTIYADRAAAGYAAYPFLPEVPVP
jgi:hypothetical protein